ncbi:NFACT family protein [bacterium]|nr:NFACT family protein [bacterium]
MISFDYLTLKAFCEENKDFFVGARLQKIQQPTRRDFVFSIRGTETRKLYINIDPQVFHVCFLNDDSYAKRNIIIPKQPPMFCMLLRKYLEGFRITEVKVPPYERIFEIYFESYNELNEKIKLCLAIELMGKHSNIILYNYDTNTIIGCAHNVGPEKSKDRELAGGFPYNYPPKQNKSDFLRYFGEVHYNLLNDDFMGFSKAFQTQLESNKICLDKIKDYLELKSEIKPALNEKEFSIYSELIDYHTLVNSVNDMIDNYFSNQQENILKRAIKLKLKNIVYPQYKKQKTLTEKLSAQLSKKDNASKYKKYADLIVSNLYNNSDYINEIQVFDWENNKDIKIPLDEKLTLKENSQKYYQLYSKSKNSKEKIIKLKEEAIINEQYFKDILFSIENSNSLKELFEIMDECEDLGFIKKDINKPKTKDINIENIEINGFKVYIGKNNKQNDLIISKISSPDDIWFHIQNNSGSHILLKIFNNKQPDEKTIYECCKLAKKYSSASNDTKAGVIYTKRKYIKKPPKANLGYVIYKNEKEIVV